MPIIVNQPTVNSAYKTKRVRRTRSLVGWSLLGVVFAIVLFTYSLSLYRFYSLQRMLFRFNDQQISRFPRLSQVHIRLDKQNKFKATATIENSGDESFNLGHVWFPFDLIIYDANGNEAQVDYTQMMVTKSQLPRWPPQIPPELVVSPPSNLQLSFGLKGIRNRYQGNPRFASAAVSFELPATSGSASKSRATLYTNVISL